MSLSRPARAVVRAIAAAPDGALPDLAAVQVAAKAIDGGARVTPATVDSLRGSKVVYLQPGYGYGLTEHGQQQLRGGLR